MFDVYGVILDSVCDSNNHYRFNTIPLTHCRFDVLRSVVFFYIKSPLHVEEAGLQELIPTTWWPNRFNKEVRNMAFAAAAGFKECLANIIAKISVLSRCCA